MAHVIAAGLYRRGRRLSFVGLVVLAGIWVGAVPASQAAAAPPSAAAASAADTDNSLDIVAAQLESEAVADASALPAVPAALAREWRSLDRAGSAIGALAALGWIALVAIVALAGEKLAARAIARRVRRRLRTQATPSLASLLRLLGSDLVGLAVFVGIYAFWRRHLMAETSVSAGLAIVTANVLVRWRAAMVVVRIVLRPGEPGARLVELADSETRRLARFLSGILLAMIAIVGIARYGELSGLDGEASHVIGLITAVIVGGLYCWAVVHARSAVEGLLAGRRGDGIIAAIRASLARAWVAAAVSLGVALVILFAFGLSLGLLNYYYAITSSLGVWLMLIVLQRLLARAWGRDEAGDAAAPGAAARAVAYTSHRITAALLLLIAVTAFARVWIGATDLDVTTARHWIHAVDAAAAMLFIAYALWEIGRLAIERHLQEAPGVMVPGAAGAAEAAPAATRLQTILPFLRAAFGIVLAVVAALVALSSLGVDTAPLIAGAGVFGLAVSFGSQSLVRDIISGLFYMWDDAFRVGEYIDSGRLKGTVETMGLRSVKVRHQNGPLHTIPYGQLGAVTNMSRDFATMKFNLRLERGCDVETVRKAVKQIGIAMQNNPEMAAEVILPLKMQGIVDVADSALIVRFKFTARPIKPSWVQREYLKQIYTVFAEKGIAFASGALTLQTLPPVESHPAALPVPLPAPTRVA